MLISAGGPGKMETACFDAPERSLPTRYAEGTWEERTGKARYRIPPHFWEALGTGIRNSAPQNYGRCDSALPNRTLYEWKPNGCSLQEFDRLEVCEALRGRSLLMVGDSTVFQLWLSFALLLGSSVGKNIRRSSTVSEITASACDDATRLAFVRNDLLLYTTHMSDFKAVQRCDGYTSLNAFTVRASRDADVVILGVGHHFPGSLDMGLNAHGPKPSRSASMAYHAFFPGNLNHTLKSLITARSLWGHHDPGTVLVVGTTTPVAGCSRFSSPISLATFTRANYDHRRTVSSPTLALNQPAPLAYPELNVEQHGEAIAPCQHGAGATADERQQTRAQHTHACTSQSRTTPNLNSNTA